MTNDRSYLAIVDHYESCLEKHGDTHRYAKKLAHRNCLIMPGTVLGGGSVRLQPLVDNVTVTGTMENELSR